jgi:hypothetical protein
MRVGTHRPMRHCFQKTVKNLKAIASLIVLVFLCLMQLSAAQSSPQTNAGSAQASLDLLVSRIDNYWKLLLESKKLQAAEFVAPSDRERFANRQVPSFSEPRLKSVEFSNDDRTTAQVVVTVKRILPFGPMEWPVGGQWVFDTDNWYLRVPLSSPPMFSELLQKFQVPLDANQIEAEKRERKNMLRFEKSVLDFGTVRQGSRISLSLKYTLTGNEAVRIDIKDGPPGIKIQGMKEQNLIPGKLQELSILAPTSDYDGAVNERVVLATYRYGVEVPFEFSLQGFVYTPVSVTPKGLRFIWAKGEREKEFSVRNNSKSTLELKSLISKTNLIAVEPLPATIQPGQQLAMKVRQVGNVQQRNVIQDLEIVFSKPVDDMESLRLAVLLNAVEEMPRNIDEAPAVTPQIQELIRKNQVILPKR